jgi:hypothetical protein
MLGPSVAITFSVHRDGGIVLGRPGWNIVSLTDLSTPHLGSAATASYGWRKIEAKLNSYPQFITERTVITIVRWY